jgi:hypothetical protein
MKGTGKNDSFEVQEVKWATFCSLFYYAVISDGKSYKIIGEESFLYVEYTVNNATIIFKIKDT